MLDIEKLEEQLFEMQDLKYRDFHSKLLPGIDKETLIGIRTPMLRKFSREFAKTPEAEEFLQILPHRYYEENNMHMMIVTGIKDYETCLAEVKKFLPYINNWATCDLPAPKCFAKHREELLPEIRSWIASGATYTIRYGTGMLMNFYLDDRLVSCHSSGKTMGSDHSLSGRTAPPGMGTQEDDPESHRKLPDHTGTEGIFEEPEMNHMNRVKTS